MHEKIVKLLMETPHDEGSRLPSVRTLMQSYSVSSSTVQKALAELEKKDKIIRLQGKGCFWKPRNQDANFIPNTKSTPTIRESAMEKLSRLFNDDWERGYLSPREPLPLSKELGQRYNVSQTVLRNFLSEKVEQGILVRYGRQYSFAQKKQIDKESPLSELIFVTRCNSWGGFTAESERELDLLRMVYKKAGSSRYKLILLGINENSGTIIDRSGKKCNIEDYPNAVGAFLSTLLVMNPSHLLQLFSNVKYPVAVWWEQPPDALPARYLSKPNWAFFNSTFGTPPGLEVGKYLLAQNIRNIAFISPYHDSSWSIDRLKGLRDSGVSVVQCTDKEFASPWDYRQIARQNVAKYSVEAYARELLKNKLSSIMKNFEDCDQTPWVCVNDDVASVLIEMAEEGRIKAPKQIFAFDNSAESYLLRLPSYDFNTQALVDQMFYYIENPENGDYKKGIHQILGQVVEK